MYGAGAAIVAYYVMMYLGDALGLPPIATMGLQFMVALYTKKKVDELLAVKIVGQPAPPVKDIEYFQGSPVTLGNGKVTVVEFWATWCPPCRTSIKHLNESYHKYKTQGVEFVGITNETQEVIKKYKSDGQYPFPVYPIGLDHNNSSKGYPREGIPAAFIVGKDGNIAWQGHPMSGLDAALEEALNVAGGTSKGKENAASGTM